MKPCRNWKRYKGLRPPKCDGGVGCEACWKKYNEVQKQK